LILALGTYEAESLSSGQRDALVARLLGLYEHDPGAGIHGASAWTSRQWKQQRKLEAITTGRKGKDRGDRRWFVNTQRQTLILIEGPVEFRMGAPPSEPVRFDNEALHQPRALHLSGYRLPTEAEWEYAARAGALTSRHYGVSQRLLGQYAWYLANSNEKAWPVASLMPNDLGLFDILGKSLHLLAQAVGVAPHVSPPRVQAEFAHELRERRAQPKPPAADADCLGGHREEQEAGQSAVRVTPDEVPLMGRNPSLRHGAFVNLVLTVPFDRPEVVSKYKFLCRSPVCARISATANRVMDCQHSGGEVQ
jgi:hypothetical protein